MSINWVMLAPSSKPPYTPLANEQNLFTSSPRVALSITSPSHYPGKQQQPFSLTDPSGIVYLTNRRIIYLPDKPAASFQNFATPLLNLHDAHVTAPWFGPNVIVAHLQPVQGGGIPAPNTGVVELKFTFKDGGAFDFFTQFERVKERLQQVMEVSRIDGDGATRARASMNGLDVANVNLEDLPVYQEESDGPLLSPVSRVPAPPPAAGNGPPSEPPPAYEEAQIQRVQEEADRGTR